MTRPAPKKAAQNPVAAALLSNVLKKVHYETADSAAQIQAEKLEQIARESEKTPQGPYAKPMRKLIKAMKPIGQ